MPYMRTPPRESRTLHREVPLSPRPSMHASHGPKHTERLPSIQDILPDIPRRGDDRPLTELRPPIRPTPPGPSRSVDLPTNLLAPYSSSRPRHSSDRSVLSQSGSHHHVGNGSSRPPPNYDMPSPYPLPMHSGPPPPRYSESSSLAPPSPYVDRPDSRQGYHSTTPHSSFQSRQGESSGLPPPPAPYFNQYNTLNGHSSSYDGGRGHSNGDAHCGDGYYSTSRSGGSPYHSSGSTYSSSYSYQVSPSYNGHYASQNGQQYQNGFHWPVQFESEDVTSQVPKKRRGNLPREITDLLKQWYEEHLAHPYPTEEEKQMLCSKTGLAMTQISNWFINSRRRRGPQLESQANAEKSLRERSGDTSSSSD